MHLLSFIFLFFPLCLFGYQTITEADNSDDTSKLVFNNFEKKSSYLQTFQIH